MSQIREKIQDFITMDRTADAIDYIIEITGDDKYLSRDFTLLKSRFTANENQFNSNLIDKSYYDREKAKINYAIQQKLSEIEKVTKSASPATSSQPDKSGNTMNVTGNGNTSIQGTNDSTIIVGGRDNEKEKEDDKNKKKILFLSAAPNNKNELRFSQEIKYIDDALKIGNRDKKYSLRTKGAVRAEELSRIIRTENPHILHISTHAHRKNGLLFEDLNRNEYPISAEDIESLFARLTRRGTNVECVIFNACNSEAHAEAIQNHINYSVGMQDFIPDEAALKFSKAFYETLFDEDDIMFAYDEGVYAIQIAKMEPEGEIEVHEIPKLFTKNK